jgi:DNA polymerase III gamma/tau subunit
MLSKQAQDTLLKLIEEPPSRFLALFCTTDPEKVSATIRSRCSRFQVKPLPPGKIRQSLERIFRDAGQPVEASVLDILASTSDGSLRDLQQVADQLIVQAGGELIDDDMLESQAGIASARTYRHLAGALSTAWAEGPGPWFEFVEELWSVGFPMETLFYQVLINFLRDARIALCSRGEPAPVVPYWSGIPHNVFQEKLSFTQRDLDIFDQAWDEQSQLMKTGVLQRAVIEFWFLKAWDVRTYDRGGA